MPWRIEQERKRASSPIAACVKLYRMMWESYAGECGLIDTIQNAHNSSHGIESLQPKAKVLSFSREDTSECPTES